MSQKKKKSGKTKKPNKSVAPSLNEDTMDEGSRMAFGIIGRGLC